MWRKHFVRCVCAVIQSRLTLQLMDCSLPGPLSMEISSQKYCSWLPYFSPGDPSDPGIEHASFVSPTLAGGFFRTSTAWGATEQHVIRLQNSFILGSWSKCCSVKGLFMELIQICWVFKHIAGSFYNKILDIPPLLFYFFLTYNIMLVSVQNTVVLYPHASKNGNSQVALVVKKTPACAGDIRATGSIAGSGRSAGEGNDNLSSILA